MAFDSQVRDDVPTEECHEDDYWNYAMRNGKEVLNFK